MFTEHLGRSDVSVATVQALAADPSLRKLPISIIFQGLRVSISVTRSLGSKKVNRAKRKAQQQRAALDVAREILPTGPTPLLYPSPEDPSPGASADVVGSEGDVVTCTCQDR